MHWFRTAPCLALAAGLVGACSLLADTSTEQCAADGDCARFGNYRCDLSTKLCVQRTGGGPTGDAADDAATTDAAVVGNVDADAEADDPCVRADKPKVKVSGSIDGAVTWPCTSDYLLSGIVHVVPGATLTIDAGAVVLASTGVRSGLIVDAGARLIAVGQRDRPIVFTSDRPEGQRVAGDWLGLALVGKARINRSAESTLFGISTSGGTDDDDDSGALSYVRIEYTQAASLSLFGVGRRTRVDHVQVRKANQDCFGWYGGTVDGKYLVCSHGGTNGFAWNYGYRGRLQFLAFQARPDVTSRQASGIFSGTGTADGGASVPSSPTVSNVTLCGRNRANLAQANYGLYFTSSTEGAFSNLLVTGFEAAINVRSPGTKAAIEGGRLLIGHSLFAKNSPEPLAFAELGSPDAGVEEQNDDDGFDERAHFGNTALAIEVSNAEILPSCFVAKDPEFRPDAPLENGAIAPPSDGFFDTTARYRGAFRDKTDGWATGPWVVLDNTR
jgi:hypothetical protein